MYVKPGTPITQELVDDLASKRDTALAILKSDTPLTDTEEQALHNEYYTLDDIVKFFQQLLDERAARI